MLYGAAKKLGYAAAQAELMRQISEAANAIDDKLADWAGIPAALTLCRAVSLEAASLNVNSGATIIAKGRSVSAFEFLQSTADVWLSVDDDVVVSLDAVEGMIQQCRAEPCLVIAPCLARYGESTNFQIGVWNDGVEVRTRAPNGTELVNIEAGGFGCFAVSREVIQSAWDHSADREFWQETGSTRGRVLLRAIFGDEVSGRRWLTEDVAFCHRHVRPRFRLWAMRSGFSIHNGRRLDLATLEELVVRDSGVTGELLQQGDLGLVHR